MKVFLTFPEIASIPIFFELMEKKFMKEKFNFTFKTNK